MPRSRGRGAGAGRAARAPALGTSLRGGDGEPGWSRVFVKPAHGSSRLRVWIALAGSAAAGGGSRPRRRSSCAGGRLYNSLRVRRYDDERTSPRSSTGSAPDGLHVERWFPKAGLGGRVVDLRVVVIAGRAAPRRRARQPVADDQPAPRQRAR